MKEPILYSCYYPLFIVIIIIIIFITEITLELVGVQSQTLQSYIQLNVTSEGDNFLKMLMFCFLRTLLSCLSAICHLC